MRRLVLLGSTLLLSACGSPGDYVGNPFDGWGGFIGDTHGLTANANGPIGDSVNMQRVRGNPVTAEPLLPEPGNIWPGMPRQDPTLIDIQREQNGQPPQATQPQTSLPPAHPQPRGSSTPPGSVQPGLTTPAVPTSRVPPPPVARIQPPASVSGVVQTPQGPAVINSGGNGVQSYTMPNGATGRAIPNGNGTVTLIGPDGSVQSVPAPR